MKRFVALLMLAIGLLGAGGANAVMTVNIYESGGNVIASFTGSINTTGLTSRSGAFTNILYPQGALAMMGAPASSGISSSTNRFTTGISGPTTWGTGASSDQPTSATGVEFGVDGGGPSILLPTGYISGANILGSSTFSGSLTSLGFNSGTYSYTLPNDTITVIIASAPAPAAQAVPTLSEWAQLMLGLMVISMIGWHFHRERSY